MGGRSTEREVAVIGAGIAGLTLACALVQARHHVTVYEAQPGRTSGAALALWPKSRKSLQLLGVNLPPVSVERSVSLHRMDGRRIVEGQAPQVGQVMRADLMEALEAAVPPGVTRVSARVDDPESVDADVVIGADGVRSVVRGIVEPRCADRRETEWVTLRGVRRTDAAPTDGDDRAEKSATSAREFWGAGRVFGDAPVEGGRYWFTAHRSALGPEPLGLRAVIDEAREVFARDSPIVREALEGADDRTLATRLWVAPPMRRYVRGRYVVIGDAAHAALPNLGRGASDAILDAASLADALNRGSSLAAWQARRVPATQAARFGAGAVMRVATSERPSVRRRFT